MRDEILKILEMQEQGLLSKEQAAELLAALASRATEAREKGLEGEDAATRGRGNAASAEGEASGTGTGGNAAGCGPGRSTAAGVVHDFVDAAFAAGTTVGRVASVWGSEVASAVHRDEGGNSVTLSKVDSPAGDLFKFRGNSINVSKVAEVMLRDAEMCENSINASKVVGLSIQRGRFCQCNVSASSIAEVEIEGVLRKDEADGHVPNPAEHGTQGDVWSAIRGTTLNATKFSRVRVAGGSAMEGCTLQAAVMRDLELENGTVLKNAMISASNVSRLALTDTEWTGVCIERSPVQGLAARESTMENVTFSGVKIWESRVINGVWKNVKVRREVGGREVRVEDSTFESCDFEGCEFAGCTFKRTTIRGVKVKGVTVRNVDFTGMVIEGEEMFRKAIGG